MKDELKIGLVIAIALFIFGFLVISIGKVNLIQKGYTFTIRFDYVSGLTNGAGVMVSGMSIGSVKGMFFKNNKVYVNVWVKDGINIPSDSMITVNTLGLLGEKYIEITPGKSLSYIKNKDFIVGINPVNVSEILTRSEACVYKMERTVTILDKLMGEEEMLKNLEDSLCNLSKITQDSSEVISLHKGEIIRTIENINTASRLISDILKENKENIKSSIVEFKEASSSLQKTTKAIDKESLSHTIKEFNKAATGLSKIVEGLKPDEIKGAIAGFNRASSSFNELLAKNEKSISQGIISFNKAMNSFEMVINELEKASGSITASSRHILKTAKNLEELSSDLKQNPWKLLKK